MASKKKRRRYLKNIFVHVLRAEIIFCILLIVLTIGVQIYNLISPPVISNEMPSIIGEETLPFRLTPATVFPFLMLPLLFLVILALYLQHFFSRVGFGFSDKIPLFDKHRHTKFGRNVCRTIMWLSSALSFVLCAISSVMHGIHTLWFGLLVVIFTGYLFCKCAKMFRHRRRQYLHNRHKSKGAA